MTRYNDCGLTPSGIERALQLPDNTLPDVNPFSAYDRECEELRWQLSWAQAALDITNRAWDIMQRKAPAKSAPPLFLTTLWPFAGAGVHLCLRAVTKGILCL